MIERNFYIFSSNIKVTSDCDSEAEARAEDRGLTLNFHFFFFNFFFLFLHRAWLELVLFFLTLNIYMEIYIKMFSKYFLLLAGLFLLDHGHSSHLIPLKTKMCCPFYHPEPDD